MKTLNIKLTGSQHIGDVFVYADEKPVTLKKNEFANLVGNVQTENDKINVKIFKAVDIGGFWWFLTQLFFFVISIFGIFDIHPKHRSLGLVYESEVELTENNSLELSCCQPADNSIGFQVKSNVKVNEINNKYFIDAKAKKKLKILLIVKILLAIAIIATIITVLALTL